MYGSPILREDFCDAIRSADADGGHQFIPCALTMPDGSPASTQTFCHFVCGRRVASQGPVALDSTILRTDRAPSAMQRLFVNHQTALALAGLPVRSSIGNETPLFLSQSVLDQIRARALPGFKEFSEFDGRPPETPQESPETLAHVWIADPVR